MNKFLLYFLNIIGLLLTLFGLFKLALLLLNGWMILSLIVLIHLVILISGVIIFAYSKRHLNAVGNKVLIPGIIVTIIFITIFFMYYAPTELIYSILDKYYL